MNQEQFWRNFSLNRELHVAGGFIYDGMRELHDLKSFDNADEVFQMVYSLAVGFERVLKIAVVLLEYKEGADQKKFERSLITHNHLQLLQRIKAATKICLAPEHNEFLQILGKFYKSYRYDRFSITSAFSPSSETEELLRFLRKHIPTLQPNNEVSGGGAGCSREVKAFLARVCQKISTTLYTIIGDAARAVNLFTEEIRDPSKAYKVFMTGDLGFTNENLLWKEILIFLMNSPEDTAEIRFLRTIQPLDLDSGMIEDYLECLGSDIKKIQHVEELKELYRNIDDASTRQDIMNAIGSRMIFIDDDELEKDESE